MILIAPFLGAMLQLDHPFVLLGGMTFGIIIYVLLIFAWSWVTSAVHNRRVRSSVEYRDATSDLTLGELFKYMESKQ